MSFLAPWHDFFMLVGGSCATLLGLVFVSASIAASIPNEKLGEHNERQLWVLPNLAHFGRALLISVVAIMPGQTPMIFGVVVLVGSILDLLAWVWRTKGFRKHQQRVGDLVGSDWLWHVWQPLGAAVCSFAGGLRLMTSDGGSGMYFVAASAMWHVLIAIHNSWEVADYLASLQ